MKKELIAFPFDKYAEIDLSGDILAPFRYNATWLLPQAMAFLGSDSFRLQGCTDKDKIDMEQTFLGWCDAAKNGRILSNGEPITFSWFKGFIKILNRAPRGELLGSRMTQSKPEGARWSAAVPLILSAFKEYRKIPYKQWNYDPKYLKYFVDKNLEPLLLLYPYENPFSNEELLSIRDETDNGKAVTARTTITTCSDEEFNKLPKYLKTLLCQVWVWNPAIRHSLAITNLQDLDTPAEPLVSSEIFQEEKSTGLPW